MLITERTIVRARPEAVWEGIGDPTHWPRNLGRMHCAHLDGSPSEGSGARYWLHLEVGAAEVGSLIEILEYEPQSTLSWTTIRGLEQRGRWQLRDRADGSTEVTLHVNYQAAGGIAALVTDEISSLVIRRYLRDSLGALSRQLGTAAGDEPAGGETRLLEKGAHLLGDGVHAARALTRARLVRPARPDRYARALAAVARWGQTNAAGYTAAAVLYPGDPAVIDELGTLTFAQVQERTSRLANSLADHGIGVGDNVAVMCRNHRGFVETLVALSKLGADALLLNTGAAGPQLTELIKRERPQAIVYDAEFGEPLSAGLRGRKGFIAWAEPVDTHAHSTLEELIAAGDPNAPAPPRHDGRTTILTSGTTGTPKGASRGPPPISAALSILDSIPLRSRERVLVSAPLFHQWGFAHLSLAALLASTLVLQRRFDPEATLATIERERITCCPAVPIMLQRILELPPHVRHRYDTSALRTVPVSGSALPGALATRFMDEYGDILYNLYGTTEVAWATIARPADLRRAPGTAGRPPRNTIVRILDEHGARARAGRTGRIFVGNEMLLERHAVGATATIDGLMATGDVGHLDDHGRLFVEGRDDEMIVSGAENVFPQQVEDLLVRHDAVREAAVIGVDDEQWGQRLKAFVVADDVGEDELKAYAADNLARHAVPREVVFLAELPRNDQGKVLKGELEHS
ncbi:MAG: AMP-binding protein [Solirubrobacteraceae bacterium]